MSRRTEGKKYQPPWAWFVYNITFKSYEMCGYASENGAKRQVAALNKGKGGVWEAHTRKQLVSGDYPVEGLSREWLLYEIGVRGQPVKYGSVSPHFADWMFPFQRFVYPVGLEYPASPKDELWPLESDLNAELSDMAGDISTLAKGILKDLDKEFPPDEAD